MATNDEITGWFAGRLPDGWFTGAPSVTIDEKQILVVGTLTPPDVPDGASAELRSGAEAGRIRRFREATRPYRILIAREAERLFEKNVTWGAISGGTNETFTPGGSGRPTSEEGGEAKKTMIGHWRGRRGWRGPFGGPRGPWAGRFGSWARWPEDVQRF